MLRVTIAGEIHAMIKGGKKLLNPLIAAQNFEYKMSNILGQLKFNYANISLIPSQTNHSKVALDMYLCYLAHSLPIASVPS